MAQGSPIEWTEATWNPVTGCTKTSPGCRNCYAERMAQRLQAMGQANYRNGFELTLQPHMVGLPLRWKTPRTIFVNSMSDLFHDGVPVGFIHQVFAVMREAHWHRFQILTKRSERLARLDRELDWPPNVWMGVSVESEDWVHRIDQLRATRAGVPFFFKQWGGVNKKRAGRRLEGRTWDEMPLTDSVPAAALYSR
jgi:protein gp37